MDIKTKIKSILENINYTLLSNLCHHFHELNLNLSSEVNFRLFENEELFYDIQIQKLKEEFLI